jgi:RNA polymerase sigma factor (TIGR02999 family)
MYTGAIYLTCREVEGFIPYAANASLSWHYRKFSTRVLYNFTGEYINTYNATPALRLYRHSHKTVNAGVAYQFRPTLSVSLDAANIFNEPHGFRDGLGWPFAACFLQPLVVPSVVEIARVLEEMHDFDPRRPEELLPLVYDELRRVAAHKMASQPAGHTLQATALVHEAFLRLVGNADHTWANRRHFFAAAAEAMRHILVDRARRKAAVRHGGNYAHVALEEVATIAEATDESVVMLNDALDRFAAHDPPAAELVRLRYFAGFNFAQTAELLDISERTAKRMWAYARAWLFDEIVKMNGGRV